jgi:ATP-dependent Clp protease ATP-binding subunit ClpC
LADQELSLNLSDEAADLLVEKGWDPAMGARPLRRAIQRYIEDPLADEVLAKSMEPGSTIEVERGEVVEGEGNEAREVKITIQKPVRKREAVGVGAKGGDGGDLPEGESSSGEGPAGDQPLPEPEVLPDVPDAPPAPDDDGGSVKD